MAIYSISEFKEEMNKLAGKGEPFLFIIDFGLTTGILVPINDCEAEGILFNIEGKTNCEKPVTGENVRLKKHPVPYSTYLKSFQIVQEEVHKGNSYLVNLTFQTPVESNFTLHEIYDRSSARYKLLYKNDFLVFSPESFVKISKGTISTFPMKGTIDANLENAAETLLQNKKETAEHATIVDLLRNDLSIVSSNVKVERYRYLEKIFTSGKTLLQTSSHISGDLPAGYQKNIGNILLKLLPAGSICGAPKNATSEIISRVENSERGFYTGICGIFDGENLNSGVMIRFIQNKDGQLSYMSGGGLTAWSNPEEEYQELIDKIYVPTN